MFGSRWKDLQSRCVSRRCWTRDDRFRDPSAAECSRTRRRRDPRAGLRGRLVSCPAAFGRTTRLPALPSGAKRPKVRLSAAPPDTFELLKVSESVDLFFSCMISMRTFHTRYAKARTCGLRSLSVETRSRERAVIGWSICRRVKHERTSGRARMVFAAP